jgi:DNA-binding NarL/FixJ family response regulator
MTVTILLVEGHAVVREALRLLLETKIGCSVIEASDGQTALQLAREHMPMLILLEVALPGIDGIETARRIHAELPNCKIIALTSAQDHHSVIDMLKAGAVGYLPKACNFAEVLGAMQSVLSGQMYLSPLITHYVVDGCLNPQPTRLAVLTSREREILTLFAEGLSAKAIAQQLRISVKTVGTHRENMLQKLELKSFTELLRLAYSEGVVSLER